MAAGEGVGKVSSLPAAQGEEKAAFGVGRCGRAGWAERPPLAKADRRQKNGLRVVSAEALDQRAAFLIWDNNAVLSLEGVKRGHDEND